MPTRPMLVFTLAVFVLIGACSESESAATTTQPSPTTSIAEEGAPATTLPAETTPTADASSPSTLAGELVETPQAIPTGELAHVVLVDPNDILNVRFGPGTAFDIAGSFGPTDRDLPLTDATDVINGSPWVFVAERGWVAEYYLTPAVDQNAAQQDAGTLDAVQQLSEIMAARGDLTEVTGWRGLFVAHFDPVRRFEPDILPDLLSDQTPREWGSQGCSPEECPDMTFAEAVADSFVGAWDDPDRTIAFDETIPGPGGLGEAAIVPTEFANFHYVAVHDPGDDPQFDGLDWVTWYVYLEYGDAGPDIVGLSIDSWGP